MSLNYDYTKCDDEVLTDEHFRKTVEFVVFGTMHTGVSQLKDDAAIYEYCIRFQRWQLANDGELTYKWNDLMAIVSPWKGLHTNASILTPTAFNRILVHNARARKGLMLRKPKS